MKNSLFNYVKSYIPTFDRNPREDYLTQVFSYVLSNTSTAPAFCDFLLNKMKSIYVMHADDDIKVETQVTVANGRIDMLVRAGQLTFIFEHKIDSGLSDDQLKHYVDSFPHENAAHVYTILITANRFQHTQDADVKLIWADIYVYFAGLKDALGGTDEYLVNQFCHFLLEQNLGPMGPITAESVLGYFPAQELERKLDILFDAVVKTDWGVKCPNLLTINSAGFLPTFNKSRWGRKGIDFFQGWLPGLFAGVLLNYDDHYLPPLERDMGPELVVFLEFRYYPRVNGGDLNAVHDMKQRKIFIESSGFLELTRKLSQGDGAGSFQFQAGIEKSPWRLLVLRKSMFSVLHGVHSIEAQTDALRKSICEGINLITQGDLIAETTWKTSE